MPWAQIVVLATVFGLGFGLKAQLDAEKIITLNNAITEANTKAKTDLDLATAKKDALEAQAEGLQRNIEVEREQFKKESTDLSGRVSELVRLHNSRNQNRADTLRTNKNPAVPTCSAGEINFTRRVLDFDARVLEFAGRAASLGDDASSKLHGLWEITTNFKSHQGAKQ